MSRPLWKNLPDTSTPVEANYLNDNFNKIDQLLGPQITADDTYTIDNIENYDLILVVAGNGNAQRWGRSSMILPVDEIKKYYATASNTQYILKVWATSTDSYLTFAFPSSTSVQIRCNGDRTGLLGLYGIKL